MDDRSPPAHKLCPLEIRALELLREVAPSPGHFIPYPIAIEKLARLRIGRCLALLLIAYFHKRGLLVAVCGHGIKLVPEAEAREQEREAGA